MRALPAALLACALLAPAAASAQACAGFTDVLSGSQFCPNVEWVRNRSITVGCTSTTAFCPSEVVSRAQMAAFLNRLGLALTPVDLAPVAAAATSVTPNNQPVLCATPAFAVTGYPRRAHVQGAAILATPSTSLDVRAAVVFSLDGGATWSSVPNSDQYGTLYTGQTPPAQVTLTPFGGLDLAVGQSVRFGLMLDQVGVGTTTLSAACHNRVQIWNRNGTSSPFDAQDAAGASRRS